MTQEGVIKVKEFTYVYQGFENYALHSVDLTVYKNDFLGLIGCNKAGKSTLCLSMVGVTPHALGGSYAGKIELFGREIDEEYSQMISTRVGIVFQDAESQFTQETVEDEIAVTLCNLGIEHDEMVERVKYAAETCHLYDMLDRSPFALSGGQQQRLAIACILAIKPEIIILDESTSQLDPIGRDEVFSLVTELHKAGHTIIMVDHNIEKIAEYAQRIAVMYEGEIVLCGTPQEVFSKREELEKYNIRLPQVADAALRLRDKAPFDVLPVTCAEGVEHFRSLVKGERECSQ